MARGRDNITSESVAFAGFLWGLPQFLRQRMTYAEALAIIQQRLREREVNFLSSIEHGVFGKRRSPYRVMLELAGCEFGDIRQLVKARGIESTLRALRDAGVYVSFEEFKGHIPIVRSGRVIDARQSDFDNPTHRHYYEVTTGGSSGTGRRVRVDLESMSANLPMRVVSARCHGIADTPTLRWVDIPPSIGLNTVLSDWVCGNPTARWFSAVRGGRDGTSSRFLWATRVALGVGRLSGARLPWPEYLPLDQAIVIAREARDLLRIHGRCQVRGSVSRMLRVAVAARSEGINLTGAILHGGGEPPTPAKVNQITSTGARFLASYHFTEAGAIGHGCTTSSDPNDQHVLKDHVAMIQAPRMVPGFDVEVQAFCFTTLLGTAPKLLLNVELDDYGIAETRSCGCPWEELGFTDHIRDIHSFRKLTGEGVTLVGTDMERILEEVLPARFGGTPLDYQLLEEEDAEGFTRLILLVSPSVTLADEQAPVETVLQAMHAIGAGGDTARVKWRQAGSLRVRRESPRLTSRGKLMPLQLLRTAKPASIGSAT